MKCPIDDKILELLHYYKRSDLVQMLAGTNYKIINSNSYGRGPDVYQGGICILSDIEKHEKLKLLPDKDNEAIVKVFQILMPIEESGIDITWVEYAIDLELPIPFQSINYNNLSTIDNNYLRNQLEKCDSKILSNDYDGALTNARTLLETLLKHILDKKGIEYGNTEDLTSIFKKAMVELNMDAPAYQEKSFRKIISGLNSITHGIAEVRNLLSDSHGKSIKRTYKIQKRHAVLMVNSVKVLAEYLYSSFLNKE